MKTFFKNLLKSLVSLFSVESERTVTILAVYKNDLIVETESGNLGVVCTTYANDGAVGQKVEVSATRCIEWYGMQSNDNGDVLCELICQHGDCWFVLATLSNEEGSAYTRLFGLPEGMFKKGDVTKASLGAYDKLQFYVPV